METQKILDAFREKRGEPQKGEMYLCYPCDIHDANAYCVLVEKDTIPYTIYERYTAEDLGRSVVFEQMNTKIHNRKIIIQ